MLCEGGPTLLSSALAAGVVDEMALSLTPTVVGGPGTRVTAGPPLGAPDGIRLSPGCSSRRRAPCSASGGSPPLTSSGRPGRAGGR